MRPVWAEYVPASQSMQPDAPVEGWYVPAAQEVHELAALAEYFPAPQSSQLDAPAAEYVPVLQPSAHETFRPMEEEYLPASHEVHS